MKVWSKLIPLALGALLLSAVTAPTASAAFSYDGRSPYEFINGHQCIEDASVVAQQNIVRTGVSAPYGTVYLWRSSRCSTFWASVNMGTPMAANTWAIAYVTRLKGDTIDTNRHCDSDGGNDHVTPGQTTCYSSMLHDPDPLNPVTRFYAQGHEYHPKSGGGWQIHATGKTVAYW